MWLRAGKMARRLYNRRGNVPLLNFVLIVICSILSVVGLVLIKLGAPSARSIADFPSNWRSFIPLGGGMLLYLISFAVWIVILSRVKLSIAYPVTMGLTFIFVAFSSVAIFRENIGPMRLTGFVLIFTGIMLVMRE